MSLLKRDVSELKGIKPHTIARLHHLGLLSTGQVALVFGKVQRVKEVSFGRKILICTIDDGSSELEVKFFHYSFSQASALKKADYLQCFGEVRWGFNQTWEMIHPEYKIRKTTEELEFESTLTPVYPTTDGLTQKTLRYLISQALSMCDDELCEYLPDHFLQVFSYPRFRDAIYQIHLPNPAQGINLQAYQRLAHEELITHYLTMCCAKANTKKAKAAVFKPAKKLQKTFLTSLPFTLTGAQLRVISEIAVDCTQAHPM
jgi:ATP-dependent DNA helicase RecG